MENYNNKIFLWGYYGAKNVGDDLLLSLFLDFLLKYKGVKIQVIVAKVYEDSKKHDSVDFLINPVFISLRRFAALKNIFFYVKTIKNNDLVIFGGGTVLFETDKTKYKSLLSKYLILLINSMCYRRPILHLGVGVGNVKTSIGKFCLRKILNYADAINLRETQSYETVLSYIKDKRKVSIGNDLAYLRPFSPRIKKESYNIGMSLFQYYGYISNEKSKICSFYSIYKNMILKILEKYSQLQIHLFSFQKDRGGNDEEFNLKFKNEIVNNRLHVYPYSSNLDIFVKNMKSMDLCIGMRLHFLILSILHGIPIIGLNYQPKIKNELLSLGLEKFCIEIDNIPQILLFLDSFIENRRNFYSMYDDAFDKVKIKNYQTNIILSNLLSPYL